MKLGLIDILTGVSSGLSGGDAGGEGVGVGGDWAALAICHLLLVSQRRAGEAGRRLQAPLPW